MDLSAGKDSSDAKGHGIYLPTDNVFLWGNEVSFTVTLTIKPF